MTGAAQQPPGWHGKLPSLGDFASRRLPAEFVEAWDLWLAEGLAQLHKADGQAWLQAYLDSPTWRFLLMPEVLPGAVGQQVWIGVLMPSVDRVGRYFPLTIAQALPCLPGDATQRGQLSAWLDRLDQIAVDALYDDWSIDRLEDELLKAMAPRIEACASDALHGLPDAPGDGLIDLLTTRAMASFTAHEKGATLWLGSPRDGQRPVLSTKGLPRDSGFRSLFGKPSST